MTDPRWLTAARQFVGTREVKGRKHNPLILQWWSAIRAPFTDDETPWCAAFVGGVLESVGIKSTRSAAARSYERWGVRLNKPAVGCIVTFSRKGGGHVGFCVGHSKTSVAVLGGNQRDSVNVTNFSKESSALKVTGYRWPAGEPLPWAARETELDDAPAGGPVTFMGGQPDDPGIEDEIEEGDEPKTFWQKAKRFLLGGGLGSLGLGGGWLSGIEMNTILILALVGFAVFLVVWFFPRRSRR